MSKINLTDSGKDILFKMCDGNPGGLNYLIRMMSEGKAIDPDDAFEGLGSILLLDTWEIYGTDIYILFNDICDRNLSKGLAVIRACQLGLFSSTILKDACHRQDRSGKQMIPVDDLYAKVQERLPNFDKQPTVA